MRRSRFLCSLAIPLGLLSAGAGVRPVNADNGPAKVTVSGGTFAIENLSVASVNGPSGTPLVLDPENQVAAYTFTYRVTDLSGTRLGWRVQMLQTSTFANESAHTLGAANNAGRVTAGTGFTAAGTGTYSNPVPTIQAHNVSGPIATAPTNNTPVNLLNSGGLNKGMGSWNVSQSSVNQINVPSIAYAGSYGATIVISLAVGPT